MFGLLLSVAPAFGSPIGVDDTAAPLTPDSVLTLPDVTDVNPEDLPDSVPATCARAIGPARRRQFPTRARFESTFGEIDRSR